MRKLFIGLIVLAIVAVGTYFGAAYWAQTRAEQEIDSVLAEVRAGGGTGSRGVVEVDLLGRSIKIADLTVQSGAQATSLKFKQLIASGIGLPKDGRLSAEKIELADVEIGGTLAIQDGVKITYRAPAATLTGFSGPMAPLRRIDPSNSLDVAKFWIEHAIAITAGAITIPTLTGTVAPAKPGARAIGTAGYTYSGVALRDLRDGKVAAVTVDKFTFTMDPGTGAAGKMTGELGKVAAADLDFKPTLAMLDPAKAKDEYARVYRQVTVGPYAVTFEKGGSMRIEGMALEDLSMKPAKFAIPDLLALIEAIPAPGVEPSPAQIRPLMEKIAGIYEGMRMGKFEMRGLSMAMPEGAFKLAALKVDGLENGRLGELAFEGLDTETPQKEPVKIGRFALKGMQVANLMRAAMDFATPGQQPGPDQLVGLLRLLEGAEVKDLIVAHLDPKRPFRVEAVTLSWGQFVGPIPTRARLGSKLIGPIDKDAPEPYVKALADAGFTETNVSLDLGLGWTEASTTFAVTPLTLDIVNLLSANGQLSIGNVTRDAFTLDPSKLMLAAATLEAGPIELTLRDAGALDLGIAQYAKAQGKMPEDARRELIETVKQMALVLGPLNADIPPVTEAIARFLEAPRGTITLKLTPKGRVALMQVIEAGKLDPFVALSRFKLEATASR